MFTMMGSQIEEKDLLYCVRKVGNFVQCTNPKCRIRKRCGFNEENIEK